MKVLVTGAAGFLGYAVAALLVKQGHEVTGLTRSGTSALPKGVQRLQGDLHTPETLPRAVAEVDGVCHLAGVDQGTRIADRSGRILAHQRWWHSGHPGQTRQRSCRATGPRVYLPCVRPAGPATDQRNSGPGTK